MIRFAPDEAGSQGSERAHGSAPRRQRGVLLVNVGTPDRPDVPSVRRYLAEFLSDPLVIRLPAGMRWFQKPLSRLIATFRAPRSARKYQSIWTDRGSPMRAIMEDQASALASVLPDEWRVSVAMRYGRPGIAEALQEADGAGVEELVVLPMYPQFSGPTTGTLARELYRTLREVAPHINVTARTTWYDDIGYINAQSRLIAEYASANDLTPQNTHLLFSAHGLPVSYIKRGDPFARQTDRTVKLVAERLGWPADRMSLAYQSRLGPVEWLKPDTQERLAELAREGEKRVLVCSISFPVDCLETLEEIDVRYRATFESSGGRLYLCPALNSYGPFIEALKSLVLRGPQTMTTWGRRAAPLIAPEPEAGSVDGDLDSLMMIGVSLRNAVGPGRGPGLRYSEASELCAVKKPHDEVQALLQKIRDDDRVHEAMVWNTCHRFEFYGWLKDPEEVTGNGCVIAQIARRLFGDVSRGLVVNVLCGTNAYHHMMRTVAGLNSRLPGDKDVLEQLRAAYQLAQRSGTARPRSKRLVEEAVDLERRVRAETMWGRFASGYCSASLWRLSEAVGADLADCRHVVIGGSSTSRSILDTLREQFGVHQRQVTLVYRGHGGGQVKLLRKAIGNGTRVRVQSYSEGAVIKAIADADLVFFGIDRDEPVLGAEDLRGLRDFTRQPLTIIDFNTFSSTKGVAELDGVRVWDAQRLEEEVAAYTESMCAQEQFAQAVGKSEAWIEEHVPKRADRCVALPCRGEGEAANPSCRGCWIACDNVLAESHV